MQHFSVDTTIISKKFRHFFAGEHMKKLPSKVAHNRPIFFSVLCRAAPSAIDNDSIEPLYVLNSKLKFEW